MMYLQDQVRYTVWGESVYWADIPVYLQELKKKLATEVVHIICVKMKSCDKGQLPWIYFDIKMREI